MRIKMTEKELKNQCENVLAVGYCKGQNLLDLSPAHELGYTSGVYGWKSDIYIYRTMSGLYVLISTGYAPVSNTKCVDIEPFEKKAEEIRYNRQLTFEEKREKVNLLLDSWVMGSIDHHIKRRSKR